MLILEGIRKSYGALTAVDGLSLQVRRGEILGLLGPNGAGKSTTVAMAIGLLAADAGTVRVDGGSPADPAVRRRIGFAPQSLSLYEPLTGAENLRFYGAVYGLGGAPLAARVDEALAFVGLAERRDDRVDGYSGGMKRRLNIAAAILHDPDLLLLDEPTVGVDPQSRNLIFDNILELKRRGKTVIYTTHYMEEAERLCDRVAILDHGKLLALDSVPGLIGTHGGVPVLVVRRGGEEKRIETRQPLEALNRLAAEAPVEDFHLEKSDLEQVFLHLTGRSLRD